MIVLGKTKQPRSAPKAGARTAWAMLLLALIAPSVALADSTPPLRSTTDLNNETQRIQREQTERTQRDNAAAARFTACGEKGNDTDACRLARLEEERVRAEHYEQGNQRIQEQHAQQKQRTQQEQEQREREAAAIENERLAAFAKSPEGQELAENCDTQGGKMNGSQCVFNERAQKREWDAEQRAVTDNAKKRGEGHTEEGSLTGRKYAGDTAVADQCMSACEQDGTIWEALDIAGGGGQKKSQANSCRKGTNHFPTSTDRKTQLERQIQAMKNSNPPQDTKQQEQRLEQLTAAYNCCESSCQAQAQTRKTNHQKNIGGTYTGGNDGCGQTELILAADKFVAEHGRDHSRKDFFDCINGQQANAPFCQEIKSRGLGGNCNATRMTGQLSDIAAQAAEMALTTRATTEGQNAAAATERAYMQAQNGEGVSVQKTALNESANAMDRVATQGKVTGAGVMALGAVVGILAIKHTETASEVEDIAARSNSEDTAAVGSYADGTIIKGSSASLVGSAATAVTTTDERDRAEDRGLNNMRQVAENHQEVSREALQQSLALMVKGGTQIAQAASFHRQAKDMRALAGTIVETPIAGNFGEGFQGADGSSQLISTPGLGGIGGSGVNDAAAIAVAEDESPLGPVMDLGGPEGVQGGPGSTGGLANAPIASTPLGARNGAAPQSQGPGLGSASATAAAPPAGEGGEEGDLGSTKARMETVQGSGGSGGGYAAAGGGGGSRHKTGMDLNGLLAQFLPKKGDEKSQKGSGIVDFANRQGARSIASQQNDDGSILGPNSDLFMRVSTTTQLYHRRGQLK